MFSVISSSRITVVATALQEEIYYMNVMLMCEKRIFGDVMMTPSEKQLC